MTNPLDDVLRFHADALNLRAQRQQLLASNIANADTPGYRARDIDFAKTLQETVNNRSQPLTLAQTAEGHLTSASAANAADVQYRTVLQPSLDGNTVDLDVERAQFAENAIHYEANLTFINSQLKMMLAALQN